MHNVREVGPEERGPGVSWQEELRKLDEELAAGRISADEYRVRRDKVLASAVTSGAEAGTPRPPAGESTQIMPGAQAPAPGQPPPGGQDQPDNVEKTQIVPGATGESAEQTQAVGGWQTARPQGNDSDRTQVVPGIPPQSVAGGQPPRPAPGHYQPTHYGQPEWQQSPEEYGSPWAGQDFPPLAPTGSPDWIRQGPEVFEAEGKSKTGKVLLIVLAVVLVAGLGVGAYFLFAGNKKNEPIAQTTTNQPPPPTTSAQPKDDLSVADLPGNSKIQDHVKTFADFESDELGKLLTAEETALYKQVNPGNCRLVVSDLEDGAHAYILTTETGSAANAATARDTLVELQTKYSMQPYGGDSPAGVKVTQFAKSGDIPATIRAHYSHKNTLVRIQIYGNDLDKISAIFDDIIQAQLEILPADD